MTLHDHWGHRKILDSLARARIQESLPGSLLIHGPRGVGIQHLARWLGQLLLCPRADLTGPCGDCSHCRLARKLEHPDLYWYFPLPRPKNVSSPEKLARDLEEAREEAIREIRKDPLRMPRSDEPRALYLAAARTLRRSAQRRPAMAEHQVFIIADAEALAPRESSSEAANALLKLLEEPPGSTTLILTSAEPGRLLPTIRSRTAHLHLPPLPVPEVTDFLAREAGVPADQARRAGALSRGSIGRALGFLPDEDGQAPLERTRREALDLLRAALAPSLEDSYRSALAFRPAGARGLMELFDFLEEWLRELAAAQAAARAASGPPSPGENGECDGEGESMESPAGEDARILRELLDRWSVHPPAVASAVENVERARSLAWGNVNPQLIVFGLLGDIRKALTASRREAPQGRET